MGLALGFLHSRTNLSPFTKDFRGGDQFDEYLTIFLRSGFGQTDNYQLKTSKSDRFTGPGHPVIFLTSSEWGESM